MQRHLIPCAAVLGIALGLAACTDPYDPGQRAVGGGLIGAGAGAAIGGAAGGGQGALAGALIGGAVGAVGGAATTPRPPPGPGYYAPPPAPPPPGYGPPPAPSSYSVASGVGLIPGRVRRRRTTRPARLAGAPVRNRPPNVGNCSSTSAALPSRNDVTNRWHSAKQGMVGPGTGNGIFPAKRPRARSG